MLKCDETRSGTSELVPAELLVRVPCSWRGRARLLLGGVESERSLPSVTLRISHGRKDLSNLLASVG